MIDILKNKKRALTLFVLSFTMIACSEQDNSESGDSATLKSEVPFAYVERSAAKSSERSSEQFLSTISDPNRSPLNLSAPYDFRPGAKLNVRDGLEVESGVNDVLTGYFGSPDYDVKDLNVSYDGRTLIFAAHAPVSHAVDKSWNIYTYDFQTGSVARVIKDDALANAGQDTNPVLTLDGHIVFSSDRDAGNPNYPGGNVVTDANICFKETPRENPSLLHRMTAEGEDIVQLTYGQFNHDIKPTLLKNGQVSFIRWTRNFQPVEGCSVRKSELEIDALYPEDRALPKGIGAPGSWSNDELCALTQNYEGQQVIQKNTYSILLINPDGTGLSRLYADTETSYEESLLVPESLFQNETGKLVSLVKHHFNPIAGGAAFEMQAPDTPSTSTIFSSFSPRYVTREEVSLYPNQYSQPGWYSALWPYRDGTNRYLVSWAQCSILNNGLNEFCSDENIGKELDSQYGIWVYDAVNDTRLPIVRGKSDVLYSELAMAQPHRSEALPFRAVLIGIEDNPDAARLICEANNSPPVANAGPDQTGLIGDSFSLNAAASSDPDGDTLRYQWSILSAPEGSAASISDSSALSPQITPDVIGSMTIQLIVNDGKQDSMPDTLVITTNLIPNTKPIANAGVDQTGIFGTTFNLDGSASRDDDPEDSVLGYRWNIISRPDGSTAPLLSADTETPQFTPDFVGDYIIQLIVNDGKQDSFPDSVRVTVRPDASNSAPTARAGRDQMGPLGTLFTLGEEESTDPDGDQLFYRWVVVDRPEGSMVVLSGADTANPTIQPNTLGQYTVQLIVSDGQQDSTPDTMSITVTDNGNLNNPPVANAGPDLVGLLGTVFKPSGSAQDLDAGDILTFSWRLSAAPAGNTGVLERGNTANPDFKPTVVGQYELELIVNDGTMDSVSDTMMVTVQSSNPLNNRPVAEAGPDKSALVNEPVQMEGSATDSDAGDTLRYAWVVKSGPAGGDGALVNADTATPIFVASVTGRYTLELVVNDTKDSSVPDTATVLVMPPANNKPVVDAGPDVSGIVNTDITLIGSASDADAGDTLTIIWAVTESPEGGDASLSGAATLTPALRASVPGAYKVLLSVSDGKDTVQDFTVVTVNPLPNNRPVVNAGPDRSTTANTPITLQGSATDADAGDTLSYLWTIKSGPAGANGELVDSTTLIPGFTASTLGRYELVLAVTDGKDTVEDSLIVTVTAAPNNLPVVDAGLDKSGLANETISLTGTASDADAGDTLSYQWQIVTAPEGGDGALSDANTLTPNFTASTLGAYGLILSVSDGKDTVIDTVTVTVAATPNNKPTADAGPDRSTLLNVAIQLAGLASDDDEFDTLAYSWLITSAPEGNDASIADADTLTPTFISSVPGRYELLLNVTDGKDAAEDRVIITVTEVANTLPVVSAGLDKSGLVNETITLEGTASDADNDTLTYQWTIQSAPEGSIATINGAQTLTPQFTSSVLGEYELVLSVNDGKDTVEDSVTVTVLPLANNIPVIDAGPDKAGLVNEAILLEGTATDEDNDALSITWRIEQSPEGSDGVLAGADGLNPVFTASVLGTYTLVLSVSDGKDTVEDPVTVTITDRSNTPPVVDAGMDRAALVNQNVALSATANDADNDNLTIAWRIEQSPAGANGVLLNADTLLPTFTGPAPGQYILVIAVNDGSVTVEDRLTVTVTEAVNTAPVIDAGPNKVGTVGQNVILNGTASDADGDSLTISWTIENGPTGGDGALSAANTLSPRLMSSVKGDYIVKLTVSDGKATVTDTTKVTIKEAANNKPVVDAGPDRSGLVNQTITLAGSASDADNDPLSIVWTITGSPAGAIATLVGGDTLTPTLTANTVGDYTVQLSVNDTRDTVSDSTIVRIVEVANNKPVADAGPDKMAKAGDEVTMEGSASDADAGDTLSIVWTIIARPEGSAVELENVNGLNPRFRPDVKGDYTLQIAVSDGKDTATDQAVVKVKEDPDNRPPVADAGDDMKVSVNKPVRLDGTGSYDLDGDAINYRWTILSPVDAAVVLDDPRSPTPEISITEYEEYVVQLVVNDGKANSEPDTVRLYTGNVRPVADAGPDRQGDAGDLITLDGTKSYDVDGDEISYLWSIVSKPEGSNISLSDNTDPEPAFVIDVKGNYRFKLVVNDGQVDSEPDYVEVHPDNAPPIANAGKDRQVSIRPEPVMLDGSGSYDPDGDEITYSWSILYKPEGSTAELINPGQVDPGIVIDKDGCYIIQLIVNDGLVDSEPDIMIISTHGTGAGNLPPVADAGTAQDVEPNVEVKLDGSGSFDPEGADLDYYWKIIHKPAGSGVSLDNARVQEPRLTPDLDGTYVVQLIVNDGSLNSQPDTVSFMVKTPPPACDISDITQRTLPVMIRDFKASHPDFEYRNGVDYGIVKDTLGADGKPVYKNTYGRTHTTTGRYNFDEWYRSCPKINREIPKTLTMSRLPNSTVWEYKNSSFFPIDGEGFGNSGLTNPDHNYHFTLETHLVFEYRGGEEFTFRGDDDLWLFINGKLAIDIGGVHSVIEKKVNLDEVAHTLGIEPGNRYTFDLFFAERHTTESNFMFQTNMSLECVPGEHH